MDRRQAIKLMAAVPVVGILPNICQSKETKLPVIKFQSATIISNMEEIFKNIRWGRTTESELKIKKALAWLPEDRAISFCYEKSYFYGEVLIIRKLITVRMPNNKHFIYEGILLHRTSKSIIKEHDGFGFHHQEEIKDL